VRPVLERVDLRDLDQPIGFGIGERAEQHGARNREHRRRRGDPDRKRQDGDSGKRRIAPQTADRVAQILHGRVNERQTAVLAVLFFDLRGAAEGETRCPPRLVPRHAAPHVVVGEQRQVRRDLVVELRVATLPRDQRAQPGEQDEERRQHAVTARRAAACGR
jgi:hypothetical protein